MADLYVPRDGMRIPMPYRQPDWPQAGRAVNFANPYESRLVKDGDLVKATVKTAKASTSKGSTE
ncbi:hypothetical protein [Martelella sp. HB161492]|uniref:hypothetical protein n=1 Tax=Martelella sp. HB161492 TaxID=2720726 RepID=UPI0015912228|nr:hypothetical protein [Martelella sp. HB161492]